MSLQVWLPLISSVANQGINTTATFNTSGITYTAGKLGQAATFSTSYIGINNTPLTGSITDFSLCCWMKTSTPSATMCLYNGRTKTGGAIGWFALDGVFRFDDGNQHTLNYTVPTDTWAHYCITRNASQIKLYVNGVLQVTTSSTSFTTTATKATIGASSVNTTTGSGNNLVGQLNDYRIYNHCLTAGEVKDIAKGLVLHIPMNNGYVEPTTNICNALSNTCYNGATGKYNYGTATDIYKTTGTFQGKSCTKVYMGTAGNACYPYIFFDSIHPENGAYKTVSFDFYPTNVTSVIFYTYNGSATATYRVNGVSGSGGTIPVNKGAWNHIEFTLYGTSTQTGGWGYMRIGAANHTSTTTDYWLVANINTEAKDHATPYTPSSRAETAVYDVSGYKNNGTITSTTAPTCLVGSARYDKCYNFDGGTQAIQIPFYNAVANSGIFTVNLWFYKSEWGTDSYETLLGGPSGFELESKPGSTNTNKIRIYSWGGSDGSKDFEYPMNQWNMLTMVRTTAGTTWYLNGVQKMTGTAGSIPSGNYFIGAWNSASQQNYKGKMSDFRVYTTALTQADITDLYNAPIKIASNGSLITNGEVIE